MQRQKRRTAGLLTLLLAAMVALGLAACTPAGGTQYNVSFQTNCSATVPDQTYTVGESFTLPSPYNFGYDLVGWFYDEECTRQVEATNNVAPSLDISADATLYAKWEAGEYSIFFDTGSSEVIAPVTVKMGETVTLPQASAMQIGENSYPFAYWRYTAEGSNYTDSFTLTYPEDVYLTAVYDYGVSSAFKVDEQGRYTLASNTRAVTTVSDYEMAYGTYEADITFESFSATGCGLVWNADLGDVDPAWETGVSYYYYHINATSGAMQIAYLTDTGSYVSLQIVALANNKTGFAEKYRAAKDEGGDNVFHIKVETAEDYIRCYIDDELQMEVGTATTNYRTMGGTGVGFRAAATGICFSNLKVTPSAYQIDFDTAGGDPVDFMRVAIGEEVESLPTPVRAGYEFTGWVDENGEAYAAGETLTENITLTAQWEQLQGGALIYFDTGEGIAQTIYRASGEALGELPEAQRLGFVVEGWYNGTEKVDADTVFAEAGYDGTPLEVTLTAKWVKDPGVEVTQDLAVEALMGSYTEDTEYDGYTAWYAARASYGIFEDVTLEEGVISMYFKAASYGANGFVFGASIADDFADVVDSEFKAVGSSYYYFHINNGSGVWQLVKVTDPTNPDTTNTSSPGYDVLATGTLVGYVAGGRYHVEIELQNIEGGRQITVRIDGAQIAQYADIAGLGGAALTGGAVGFRNGDGGCYYYGVCLTDVSEMEGGYTVTLDANGGTCAVASITRPAGWSLTLPAAEKEGSVFFGWTTTKDDATTLVEETTMVASLDGATLYAYYVGESETLVTFDANGGTLSQRTALVARNTALEEDFAAPVRTGYLFAGWFDEDGTEVKAGSTLTESAVTLTAKWSAVEGSFAGVEQVVVEGGFTSSNDGVYDIYSSSGNSLALLDETLASGEITFYTNITAASGNNGLLFGGTNIGNMTDPGDKENATYYYWHLNNASGAWQLAKIYDDPANDNYHVLSSDTSWKNAYGEAWHSGTQTYKMTVRMQKLESGALVITFLVNDRQFFTYTDSDPLEGTQLALRSINSPVRTWWAIRVTDEADLASGTLTLNAGTGTVTGDASITLPMGWTFTLPAATLADNNFLGWATQEGGEAVYQPGEYAMSADFSGKTLYAVFTDEAMITFVTAVGTAPQAQTVALGALEAAPAAISFPGYTFLGWFDEEDVELTTGYSVTGNVTATAKWGGVVSDPATAENVYTNTNAYLETNNNGIYNVYTVNGPSIVKFSETLSEGTMSLYINYNETSARSGILFGATALENLTNSSTSNANANYYYWYVNASSGGWILYKVNNGVSTNINDQIDGGTTVWQTVYGSAFTRSTYLFEIELEQVDTGLKITLSVDGHEFLTYTDTEPLTGTQTGYLNNANATSTTFYAISVNATAAEAAAQNSLNAVADLPRKD